jgi:plasmid stabilization system protein ParE
MQKYKIEISDLAEQDLEFAADYIAFELNNPSVAVGFRTSKIQTVQSVWLRIESPTGIF